jgi:hypothetical protein
MATAQTHYELLGVREDASPETIRQAWHRMVSASHPDAGPSEEKGWRDQRTAEINVAYGVLKDEAKRADYDAQLMRLRGGAIESTAATPTPAGNRPRTTTARPRATTRSVPEQAGPLRQLYRLVSTPTAGWLLVIGAGLLGNALGGFARAMDLILWVGLAHFIIRPSSKSPLAAVTIGTIRFVGEIVGR